VLIITVLAPYSHVFAQWRDVTASDFAPWNLPGAHYLEFWEYTFVLNETMLVSYQMSISELGRVHERVTGVRLVVGRERKPSLVVNKEFPISKMVSDEMGWFVKPNPASAYEISGDPEKDHLVYFRTRKDGHWFHVRLTLTNIRKGMRKPGLQDGFEAFPVFLNADVQGFVVVDEDSVVVSGKGFLDKGLSMQFPLKHLLSVKFLPVNNRQEAISYHIDKPVSGLASGEKIKASRERVVAEDFSNAVEIRGKSGQVPISIRLTETTLSLENPVVGLPYSILDQLGSVNRFFVKSLIGRESKEWYGLVRNAQGTALVHLVY
jgi:hypothetical protein